MSQISIEKIIEAVTLEVVKQLKQNGMTVTVDSGKVGGSVAQALMSDCGGVKNKTERIDMSNYKSPVLTEKHIDKLHELTGKIIVPCGTIITPKARESAKRKSISIVFE